METARSVPVSGKHAASDEVETGKPVGGDVEIAKLVSDEVEIAKPASGEAEIARGDRGNVMVLGVDRAGRKAEVRVDRAVPAVDLVPRTR